jgi:hypothetical protein
VPIKLARHRLLASAISAALAVCILTGTASKSLAQNAATSSNPPPDDVVLIKLSPPVYPVIARVARIQGEVDLNVTVRQDGAVAAEVVSGPPVLQQGAVESAIHSQFECKNCAGPTASFRFIYNFQLDLKCECGACEGKNSSTARPKYPRITQSENHVTIIADGVQDRDIYTTTIKKPRSSKCLWLWRCGND